MYKTDRIYSLLSAIHQYYPSLEDSWWVLDMASHIVNENGFNLTTSKYGLLVATETNNDDILQLTLQPRRDATHKVAHIIQNGVIFATDVLDDYLSIVEMMNDNTDEPMDFAIGTAIGTKHDFRIYVGSLDRLRRSELAEKLRGCGVWNKELSDEMAAITNRISLCANFMGFAKRTSSEQSYMLYFLPRIALSDSVLDYILSDSLQELLPQFRDFVVRNLNGHEVSANDYGWAVAVNSQGEFLYIKLEIKIGAFNADYKAPKDIGFFMESALMNNLYAMPYVLSYSANVNLSREVIYFSIND